MLMFGVLLTFSSLIEEALVSLEECLITCPGVTDGTSGRCSTLSLSLSMSLSLLPFSRSLAEERLPSGRMRSLSFQPHHRRAKQTMTRKAKAHHVIAAYVVPVVKTTPYWSS